VRLAFGNPALLWGVAAALVPLAIHLFFRRRPRPTPFPAIEFILRAKRETQRRLKLRRVLLFAARTALLLAAALALAKPRLEREARAAAPAAPRGPAATALVLDASASMRARAGGRPLFERARDDLGEALAGLAGEEPVTLVVCDGRPPAAAPPTWDRAPVRGQLDDAEPSFAHADLGACVAAAASALADETVAGLGKRIVVATDLAATAWRLDAPAPLVAGGRPEVKVLDAARGEAAANLAVVDLAAEPDATAGPRGFRITATLANFGAGPAKDVPVALHAGEGRRADDGPAAIRGFAEIPAGGTAKKVFTYAFPLEGPPGPAPPAGAGEAPRAAPRAAEPGAAPPPAAPPPAGDPRGPATLQVSLPGDALGVDDARLAVVAVPRGARALVVDGDPSPTRLEDEAFFVEAALASPASPVRPTLVDADALGRVRLDDFDVVLLLNVATLGGSAAALRAFVERGGGLFVAAGDLVDPDVYARELGGLLPPLHVVKTVEAAGGGAEAGGRRDARTPQDPRSRAARFDHVDFSHPALQVFTGEAREGLLGARTWRYLLVKPDRTRQDRVLAAYDDGAPALVESRAGRGRVVLFTSTADRAWSDWAIRTSFLPAVQRLAAWLAGALDDRRPVPSLVGAPRAVAEKEGRRVVAAVAPDGGERAREALARRGEGSPLVIVPDRPGLWQVKVEDGGGPRLDPALAFAAVADARESDTRRVGEAELLAWFGGADHASVAGERRPERATPLWSVLLAAALVAFFLEGVLAG
jgi:hypothetical protein